MPTQKDTDIEGAAMKIFIGVDPGKTGAVAVYREGSIVACTVMPLAGKGIDLSALATWLIDNVVECYPYEDQIIAAIEKVGAMPGQGVTSMFSFGFSTGALHGVLAALNIPRYLVTPHSWKKAILLDTKRDKAAAIDYCRQAYPNISLLATPNSRKPHSGLADAICIAKYASIRF